MIATEYQSSRSLSHLSSAPLSDLGIAAGVTSPKGLPYSYFEQATENAPHSVRLDGAMSAYRLDDIDLARQYPGHVSTFLCEAFPALQVEFASLHHIAVPDQKAFAAAFATWESESYPLAACWHERMAGALPNGDGFSYCRRPA
ncbi:hypothetical protein [Mesorhizobium sp. CN2-181]|uniref:hypothetical protein n=1 Tax=Mesorhizobium yinganensis TaxID=3157707 RepID=UPI0032B78980